jgi:20S proteasome alpha/beta subunit
VTIVAGFRCNSGVVLAADSQEVISDYAKTTAQKIRVLQHSDKWRVGIAGSADDSAYLDLFEEELFDRLIEDLDEYDRRKMATVVKEVLLNLHKEHIWPQTERKSPFQSFVVTQCSGDPKDPTAWLPNLLETKETAVIPVHGFRSLGVGTYMAEYLNARFEAHQDVADASLEHLADLCILILKDVKKAVHGCDGQTTVAVFYEDGRFRYMTTNEVLAVETSADEFQKAPMKALLALHDPNITDAAFAVIAEEVGKKMMESVAQRTEFISKRKTTLDKLKSYRSKGRQRLGGIKNPASTGAGNLEPLS